MSVDIDAALVDNHYCLNETRLLDLLRLVPGKEFGVDDEHCSLVEEPLDWRLT